MWRNRVLTACERACRCYSAPARPRALPINVVHPVVRVPGNIGRLISSKSVQPRLKHEYVAVPPFQPTEAAVSLRDYQVDAITACLQAFDRGLDRIGVSSPTGSGKTTMFMHLIPAVRERARRLQSGGGGKTLILVSGIELASQTEASAKRILGDGWTVEVEQGSRKASGKADV